jgi:hypothetical protein
MVRRTSKEYDFESDDVTAPSLYSNSRVSGYDHL